MREATEGHHPMSYTIRKCFSLATFLSLTVCLHLEPFKSYAALKLMTVENALWGTQWWALERNAVMMWRHQIVLREPDNSLYETMHRDDWWDSLSQTAISMWSSPVNYCQCLCFHSTVIRLNSDESYFGGFRLARLEGDAFAIQRYPHRPIKFQCLGVDGL